MPDLNADIAREVTRRMGDAAEYVLGGHSLPMQAFYSEDHGVMAVIIRCSEDWTGEDISDEAQIDLYERLNAVANAWLGEILATPKEIQRLSERLDETANAWIDEVRARETASN